VRETAYGGVLDVALEHENPTTPAWVFVPRILLEEVATDNVRHRATDRQFDLITKLAAGFDASVDTPRLQGVFNYMAIVKRGAFTRWADDFAQYGYVLAQATPIRNFLFLDLHGVAHEIDRQGLGIPNPSLLSSAESTQVYVLDASPDIKTRVGDIGFADLRYAYNRLWVTKNTETPASLARLTGGTLEQLRSDLKAPGTMMPRLLSDLALSARSNVVEKLPGTFDRASGELINEYQFTPSISAIAGGGYETLSDSHFALLNGRGGTWDTGLRWRPNADSSVLLLYGRHDLKTDFAGEVRYLFGPTSGVYAAYTDSINSTQERFIGHNQGALLGPEGPSVGVTFDQNPTISILNDSSVGLYRRAQLIDYGLGLPVEEVNNFLPATNGIFRIKEARGALYTDVATQSLTLLAFHVERTSLTGLNPPILKADGVSLAWSPALPAGLFGRAEIGYHVTERSDGVSDFGRETAANFALSLNYNITETLEGGIRYDYIRKILVSEPTAVVTNAVTVRLVKRFR
jgi:uncharacterized protein (PEP-CTERM system associated)